jgi:hypothetical protein
VVGPGVVRADVGADEVGVPPPELDVHPASTSAPPARIAARTDVRRVGVTATVFLCWA